MKPALDSAQPGEAEPPVVKRELFWSVVCGALCTAVALFIRYQERTNDLGVFLLTSVLAFIVPKVAVRFIPQGTRHRARRYVAFGAVVVIGSVALAASSEARVARTCNLLVVCAGAY